jgi:hypothetical protein
MNYSIISNNSTVDTSEKYITLIFPDIYVLDNQDFYKYTKILNIIQYMILDYRIIEKIILFLCIIIYPVLGLLNIDITYIFQTKNSLLLFNILLIFFGCLSLYLIK